MAQCIFYYIKDNVSLFECSLGLKVQTAGPISMKFCAGVVDKGGEGF